MKKNCAMLGLILLTAGCTKIVTTPIKVVGKVATTSIGVAGDIAVAGVKTSAKVVRSTGTDPTVVKAAVLATQ